MGKPLLVGNDSEPTLDALDEEARVRSRPAQGRRSEGAYYTPRLLVARVLDHVAPYLPARLRIIDPACGAGAFLVAAAERYPSAALHGIELSAEAAAQTLARVPHAKVCVGDGLQKALFPAADGTFELWIGNPPFNGTSALLRKAQAYSEMRGLLAEALPAGTSLRDDFAFFLLVARERLRQVQGALAFITPTSLLDSFLYAPLRRALIDTLDLREVVELGAGLFQNTRVHTCFTVWTSPPGALRSPFAYRKRIGNDNSAGSLSAPESTSTEAPEWQLRPVDPTAAALDRSWREEGQPLNALVPISFPGLKTRFNELLVDDDVAQLRARMEAFLGTPTEGLSELARRFGLPPHLLGKLKALRTSLPEGLRFDSRSIRPFFRYRGARHRETLPLSSRAYCYFDRALIPRGDHRLRGAFDPHAEPLKLVFNIRELPLSAALLEHPGCVHDHRHARFAPLRIPEIIWTHGLSAARGRRNLGQPVSNLSTLARSWAADLGGERALWARLVSLINSPQVQECWAPSFGKLRILPVSFRALSNASGWESIARRIPAHYEGDLESGGIE